jgi:nitrite reductase (NADH) small subunit
MSVLQATGTQTATAPLCRFEELPIGIGIAFEIGGRSIAVFRTRTGAVHAVDNRCPHKGGPLADGIVAGSRIVCPLHAYRFNLSDGMCEADASCRVAAHSTRVKDGWVCLDVPR